MIGEFRTAAQRAGTFEFGGWFTPSQIRALEALYPLPAYIPTPEEYAASVNGKYRPDLSSPGEDVIEVDDVPAAIRQRVTLYPGSGEEPPDYADGPRVADPDEPQ